jgi:hypothetical protein
MEKKMTQDVLVSAGAARRQTVLPGWVLVAALALFACVPGTALAQRPCPPDYVKKDTVAMALEPPAATRVPDDVCLPHPPPDIPLAYFDDHSWRTFIALVWPRLSGERGVADPEQKLETVSEPDAIPHGPKLVFETYKADWETFPFDGTKPYEWNDPRAEWSAAQWQCQALGAQSGNFFLAPSTADYRPSYPEDFGYFDNVVEFTGRPGSVLVAQNGTLVRYLAAYNQIEFNQILVKKWYLADRLPKKPDQKIEFLDGSLSVKSAWVDMAKLDQMGNIVGGYTVARPKTFHRRQAWLYDPYTRTCEHHVVGLVGLHIVHKTPLRPQWIWSTFEHVDNAPDRAPLPLDPSTGIGSSCPTPSNKMSYYIFNDGSHSPMQTVPADYLTDRILSAHCPPRPVNVERIHPINRSHDDKVVRNTQETNAIWQDELRKKRSVWQYYQLVMTQWPTDTGTIPGPDVLEHSAFSNTTLETWAQTDITSGCMSCHGIAQQDDHIDFVWSLRMNAYPRGTSRSSPAVNKLQDLLSKSAK